MRIQNPILALSVALAVCLGMKANLAEAETVVRYGISLADIPLTTGQPDRGAGAYQFTGLTLYDPLIAWQLDDANTQLRNEMGGSSGDQEARVYTPPPSSVPC